MKSSLFSRSVAYGALFALSMVSFSCNDSGNAGYGQDFNPDTSSSNGVPVANLDAGAGNALDGLAVGQTTLDAATTAVKNGESDAPTPVLNSQFAATAAPAGYTGSGFGGTNSNPGSNSGGSTSPGSVAFGGTTGGRTSSAGGGSSSAAGAGSSGMGLSSLGDTRTTAMLDPSKSGPNGDGSMSAADALGGHSNASDGAGSYAAGSGGGGRSSERGFNPFSSLFGGDGNGAGNGSGSSTTEFRRDPASLAGRADASRNGLGPMGSQDPANYFSMLKVDDNLFKIVERRYESKSRQWAISDAQQIRRSVKP